MFRDLPPAEWPADALDALAKEMTADPERDEKDPKLPAASPEDPKKRIQDDEENAGIAAGYTYLGQFIDHDITFDPASSLQQLNDPDALVDFRTPRLDLDSLYGRGPAEQPYMYSDDKRFRLGRELTEGGKKTKTRDLPRYDDLNDPGGRRRALIGDKRNDENVIVSQLHGALLQFHNKLVDADNDASFEAVQRLVRWHYQWLVVNDFLPTICGPQIVEALLPDNGKKLPLWKRTEPNLTLYKWRKDPFMPIEFSAAAYRFGHSMVRPIYRLNTVLGGGDDPNQATKEEQDRGIAGRFFIFAGVPNRGLNGFDAFPDQWAIDWSLFFDIDGSIKRVGMDRVQPSYKIDASLVNPLGFLPEFSKLAAARPPLTVDKLQAKPNDPVKNPANLAQRNLLRGVSMGLPSGQDVARALGLEPIDDDNLRVGKAVVDDWKSNKKLADVNGQFRGRAPLWYYVLAEAQFEWVQRATAKGGKGDEEPVTLGAIGQRIVAETLIGLLWADGQSYLRQAPNWKPVDDLQTMGKLIRFALS